MAGEIPRRPKPLDQAQGGVILMLERRQHGLTHLTQKCPKCWVSGKVRSQDNRVGEETHHPVKFGAAASDHGGSHEDVFLAAVVVEHQLERRQQDHEQRGPLGSGERPEPLGQVIVESKIMLCATKHLDRRSRPVGRQIEHG